VTKHVLIIPSWYKSKQTPLLGSFFEEQARGLINKGCKVSVLKLGFRSFSYSGEMLNEEYDDNGLVTLLKDVKALVPKFTKLNYYYYGLKSVKIVEDYIAKYGRPDIIHAHSVFYGGIASYYISKKVKIPFVITEHLTNFVAGSIINPFDIYFSEKVFRASQKTILVSTSFKEELSKVLSIKEDNTTVIHNMVSPIFFQNRYEKKLKLDETIIFFSNAFLSERKNHSLQIKSFAIFEKKFPNSKLLIGGGATREIDVIYKNQLIDLSKSLGVYAKIEFLGDLSREDVKSHLNNCHVFLFTSFYETFGVVLIESLAVGRPVISTDSKGPRDIVDSKNGILVRDFEETTYSRAMIEMIEKYTDYHQDEISKNCYLKFGEEHITQKLLDVYETVIPSFSKR